MQLLHLICRRREKGLCFFSTSLNSHSLTTELMGTQILHCVLHHRRQNKATHCLDSNAKFGVVVFFSSGNCHGNRQLSAKRSVASEEQKRSQNTHSTSRGIPVMSGECATFQRASQPEQENWKRGIILQNPLLNGISSYPKIQLFPKLSHTVIFTNTKVLFQDNENLGIQPTHQFSYQTQGSTSAVALLPSLRKSCSLALFICLGFSLDATTLF